MLIFVMIFLSGCPGKKDTAAKKPEMSAQKKAPPQTKQILTDIEKIIAELGQKVSMDKNPYQQLQQSGQNQSGQGQGGQGSSGQGDQGGQSGQSGQSSQSGQGGQSGQSQGGQSGQGQSSQQQSSSGQSGGKQAVSPMNDWTKIDSGLKSVYKNWNTLEPEAIKAGLSVAERNSFEQALDNLSLEINQRKKESGLMSAIELYGKFPILAKTFNMPTPPDFYQSKYLIMAASAEAAGGDWTKAQERVPKIQESWSHFKLQAKLKDEKSLNRSDFAVEDLLQAIKDKRMDTLIIKTEITLSNLQKLEKDLSSKKNSQQ